MSFKLTVALQLCIHRDSVTEGLPLQANLRLAINKGHYLPGRSTNIESVSPYTTRAFHLSLASTMRMAFSSVSLADCTNICVSAFYMMGRCQMSNYMTQLFWCMCMCTHAPNRVRHLPDRHYVLGLHKARRVANQQQAGQAQVTSGGRPAQWNQQSLP